MEATTLSFQNMHAHGPLFTELLRARHRTFIVDKHWDLPQSDGMEFDQYDTPASRWVAVHAPGRVLAGLRLTPTTHRCGVYSYMIKDAQDGLLPTIPRDLLYEAAPTSETIWECTRGFIATEVEGRERLAVHQRLNEEMVSAARELGATSVLAIVPATAPRLLRRVGLDVQLAGPVRDIGGVANVCVDIRLSAKMH
jgi:N-acyl-L-homoserine lactone synthetase